MTMENDFITVRLTTDEFNFLNKYALLKRVLSPDRTEKEYLDEINKKLSATWLDQIK